MKRRDDSITRRGTKSWSHTMIEKHLTKEIENLREEKKNG